MYKFRQYFWVFICLSLGFLPFFVILWELVRGAEWVRSTKNSDVTNCFAIIVFGFSIFLIVRALNLLERPHDYFGHYYPQKKVRVDDCVEYLECYLCYRKVYFGEHKMERIYNDGGHVCSVVEKCKKCGLEVDKGIHHDFKDLMSAEEKCLWINRCVNCGTENLRRIMHTWSKPIKNVSDIDPCGLVEYCEICGEKKFSTVHTYIHPPDQCEYDLTCVLCGKVEHFCYSHLYDSTSSGYCIRCGEYTGMNDNGYVGYY